MKLHAPLTIVVVASLMAGCGLFDRKSDYDRVPEERPLEVPPDLDAPAESDSMRVPNATYSRVARGPVEATGAASPSPVIPQGKEVLLVNDSGQLSLLLADSAESVFRRLGFALERVGLQVVEKDPSGKFYHVEYTDTEARANRPNVFSRWILRRKGPTDYSGVYRLMIRATADATVVTIQDEDGETAPARVAEDVLNALENRLS